MMELQGTPLQHDRVLQTLHTERYIRIDRTETRTIPVEKGERSFRVRY